MAGITLESMETNLFDNADLITKFQSWVYILDVIRSLFYFVQGVSINTNISQ